MLPLDDKTARRVRRISRELFGSAHRLEVAAAIAGVAEPAVYGRQISRQIGVNQNQVGEVLRHLETAKLLRRLPSRGGREPQCFEPASSRYWVLCQEVLDELIQS